MDGDWGLLLELGPVSVREALADGMEPSQLRRRALARPLRGVRSHRDLPIEEAVRARLDDRQFLSHAAAARVWGIPLPPRLRHRAIDVSTLMPHHAPRAAGVIPHRLDEEHVEVDLVHGLRITTPTETWRHLSTILSVDELVVAGDGLVRRRRPLATEAELVRAVARHVGARGVRRLRAAHALVRPRTDSARESRLRLLLTRAGLPEPTVNPEVDVPGYGTAFLDLAYLDARVAVEYDGRHHREDPDQFERDIRRHEALVAAGWRVIRVLAEHLASTGAVAARVRAALLANDRF